MIKSKHKTPSLKKAETPPAPPRVTYRVSEVAKMMGVCERTIWGWIDKNQLASVKILGVRLVRAESVNSLLSRAAAE